MLEKKNRIACLQYNCDCEWIRKKTADNVTQKKTPEKLIFEYLIGSIEKSVNYQEHKLILFTSQLT